MNRQRRQHLNQMKSKLFQKCLNLLQKPVKKRAFVTKSSFATNIS